MQIDDSLALTIFLVLKLEDVKFVTEENAAFAFVSFARLDIFSFRRFSLNAGSSPASIFISLVTGLIKKKTCAMSIDCWERLKYD